MRCQRGSHAIFFTEAADLVGREARLLDQLRPKRIAPLREAIAVCAVLAAVSNCVVGVP